MNINGGPIVRFNREREMNVFDALPPVLREELRYTSVVFSAIEVAELLTGGYSVATVLAVLRREDGNVRAAHRRKIGL